jgi:hypothetical protein
MQESAEGFGGYGLESWWLRRWAASSDRWAGRGQGTAQANRGCGRGQNKSVKQYLVSWDALRLLSPRGSENQIERRDREHLTERMGGRNGTMQEEQVWVWEGEVWWKQTGRSC